VHWLLLLFPWQESPDSPGAGVEESELTGEVSVGMRFVDVDGDEAQFDEDLNLDEGLYLRSLVLEGIPPGGYGGIDRFVLRASGVGDPNTRFSIETVGGPWKTGARYDRSRFVGNAHDDLHPFDVRRDRGSLSLAYAPRGSESRSSLELSYLERDGVALGSRSVGFSFVEGFPVRREERDVSATGSWRTVFGATRLEVGLGIDQTRSRDRYGYTLATPTFPTDPVSEDFASEVDGNGVRGELRLERELGSRVRIDAGLDWAAVRRRGDRASRELTYSFVPALPFASDTQSDLELDVSEFSGDIGAAVRLGEDSELELRYTRSREEESGDLFDTVIRDDLMGEPPSTSQFVSSLDRNSRVGLFELGLSTAAGEAVLVDLGLQWAREELFSREIVEGTTTRFFDGDLDELGAEGSVSVEIGPSLETTLSGGSVRRPTSTAEPDVRFRFDDERATFAELSGRWRPGARTTLAAHTRYEALESEPFDAEGDSLRYGLSVSGEPRSGWSCNGSFLYRTTDRVTRRNDLFFDPMTGTTRVRGLATFDGIERTLTASTACQVTPAFAPRLAVTGSLASGDTAFDSYTSSLTLPWQTRWEVELGLEALYVEFDGEGLLADASYDALVLSLYVRKGF
jgi:hypothetical protein